MKKSLQYVLIMSVFGMQSGFLYAQVGDDPGYKTIEGLAPRQAVGLKWGDFKTMLDKAKETNHFYGLDWHIFDGITQNYQRNRPTYVPVEFFMDMPLQYEVSVTSTLAGEKEGQNYLMGIDPEFQTKLFSKFIYGLKLSDNLTSFGLQGGAFLGANLGKNLYSGDVVSILGRSKVKEFSDSIKRSNFFGGIGDRPSRVTSSMLFNSVFVTDAPASSGFARFIVDKAVTPDGMLDFDKFNDKNFKSDFAIDLARGLGVSKLGRLVMAEQSSRFKDMIVSKVSNGKPLSRDGKRSQLAAINALLMTAMEHQRSFKVSSRDKKTFLRVQLDYMIDDEVPSKDRLMTAKLFINIDKDNELKKKGESVIQALIDKSPAQSRELVKKYLKKSESPKDELGIDTIPEFDPELPKMEEKKAVIQFDAEDKEMPLIKPIDRVTETNPDNLKARKN